MECRLKYLINYLCIVLILFNSFIMIYSLTSIIYAKSHGLPAYIFDKSTALVVSESMLPVLEKNDNLIIEKVDQSDELTIDDIYVYKSNDMLIVHRYIGNELDSQLLYFKGDNNDFVDSPVSREQVVAKVVGKTNVKVDLVALVGLVSLLVVVLSVNVVKFQLKNENDLDIEKI